MVDDSPGIWPKWQNTPYKQLWVGLGSVFCAHLVQHSQRKKRVTSECAINPKGICIGCQIYTNTVARGHRYGETGRIDLTIYSLKLLYEYIMSDFNYLQIVVYQGRPQTEGIRRWGQLVHGIRVKIHIRRYAAVTTVPASCVPVAWPA